MTTDRYLHDNETGAVLGTATPEQCTASDKAPCGIVVIDEDGAVVPAGEQAYGPTRLVWVGE